MYVMVVGNNLPTEKEPTVGQFAWDQAKALKEAGLEVVYMALDFRSIWHWRKWGIKKLHRDGIDIYKTDIPIGLLPFAIRSKLGKTAFNKLYDRALADKGKPCLIHAHFTDMGLVTHEKAEKEGVPLYLTEHSSKLNREKIKEEDELQALEVYPRLEALITVSGALKNNIKQKLGFDSIVIHNLVDTSIFKYSEALEGEHKDSADKGSEYFNFVSTGNLIQIKGFDILIKAFKQHLEKYPTSRLKIFGKGSKREDLEKLAQEKGIKDKIEFKGIRPRRDLADEYKKSQAFILLSYSETFGVAFIEALAGGLPVISTRSGGPQDFIEPDMGYFVNPGDIDGACKAMNMMRENYEDFNRAGISSGITEEFSPQRIAGLILEVYREHGSL